MSNLESPYMDLDGLQVFDEDIVNKNKEGFVLSRIASNNIMKWQIKMPCGWGFDASGYGGLYLISETRKLYNDKLKKFFCGDMDEHEFSDMLMPGSQRGINHRLFFSQLWYGHQYSMVGAQI